MAANDAVALNDATAQVSAFLSDSRLFAERTAKACQNKNCAYLCTGLSPNYCCKRCAKAPNQHGPRCLKKLLHCSSPGCGYAVTGLAPSHCCRRCARGEDHGPNCWLLPVPVDAKDKDDDDDSDDAAEEVPSGAVASTNPELLCSEVEEPDTEALDEETEEERALRLELEAAVEHNDKAIASNEDLIRQLQELLAVER